ncbi:MFS transporter [Actinokineospora sp. HUAS TT18]|uniref:MFS transporter n=1 Tax=Actinokineospora sp. HUAS TT18 TaxID=3447451 RepID=UPI003F51CDAA
MTTRVRAAALYVGGFLGPFAGAVTTSMLPELGAEFGVSSGTATLSLTAYLVPFALFMLVSGTLGARWGAGRSVRAAYLVYVVASAACVLAPTFELFLAARAVQGAANAFTTPLLLAAIGEITPPGRLGRALGLFGAVQAAGTTSAPLLGGLAAEVNWMWAFAAVAGAAALLAMAGLPADVHGPAESPPTLRSAWRADVVRPAAVALVGWACLGGMAPFVALRLEDDFGLSSGQRGALLTGFGVFGLLTARSVGHAIDKLGPRRAVAIGALAGAVPVVLVGLLPWIPAIALVWAVAGAATQFIQVGLNTMVLGGTGPNRAGAVSLVLAFRFFGGAAAPPAFTPIYQASPVAAFLVPAALLVLVVPAVIRQPK